LKDIKILDKELTDTINHFKFTSVSSNASSDAPIDKRNIVKLKDETAKTLENFKKSIINYLSE
jgi:hypothetical protein